MRSFSLALAVALSLISSSSFAHDIRATLTEWSEGKPSQVVWSSTLSLDLFNPQASAEADSSHEIAYLRSVERVTKPDGSVQINLVPSSARSGSRVQLASAPNQAGLFGDRVQVRFELDELLALQKFSVDGHPDPIEAPVIDHRTAFIEALPLAESAPVQAAAFLIPATEDPAPFSRPARELRLTLERLP